MVFRVRIWVGRLVFEGGVGVFGEREIGEVEAEVEAAAVPFGGAVLVERGVVGSGAIAFVGVPQIFREFLGEFGHEGIAMHFCNY